MGIGSKLMRSLKHTHKFKYTRHNQVFDGAGDNMRDMGVTMAKLRERQAAGEHIEIHSPKSFSRNHAVKDRHGATISMAARACYSLSWYTREDLGLKELQPA